MKISELQERAHKNAYNKGFWDKPNDIIFRMREKGFSEDDMHCVTNAFRCQRLMLMVSELGEAVEALRHGNYDGYQEELADTVIRILDECGGSNIDLESGIICKMVLNESRPPKHGKEF